MKTLMVAATLTVMAGAAFAAEGGGDPFRYRSPGVTSTVQSDQPASTAAPSQATLDREALPARDVVQRRAAPGSHG